MNVQIRVDMEGILGRRINIDGEVLVLRMAPVSVNCPQGTGMA